MNSEKKIYDEISQIITEIQTSYPELVKYLEEMPNTLPDKGTGYVDLDALYKYRNSLREMILSYQKNH